MTKSFVLLLVLLASMPLLRAQSYNTAAGVRLGTDWGLTVRQRVYENLTAELLIQQSLQRDESAVTILGLMHQPLLMRNLNLFIGGGFHKGWNNELNTTYGDPFGLDVLAGVELSISKFNLSWDFKPALNISGGARSFYAQSGVSLRYILQKREKFAWEKKNKKSDKPSIFNRSKKM